MKVEMPKELQKKRDELIHAMLNLGGPIKIGAESIITKVAQAAYRDCYIEMQEDREILIRQAEAADQVVARKVAREAKLVEALKELLYINTGMIEDHRQAAATQKARATLKELGLSDIVYKCVSCKDIGWMIDCDEPLSGKIRCTECNFWPEERGINET